MIRFLLTHCAVLLYAGFWISLSGYAWLAPPERMRLLESAWITQGWQLSLLALLFGGPVLGLYLWRMRAEPTAASGSPHDSPAQALGDPHE